MYAKEFKYFECNYRCIKARAGLQERQGLGFAAEVDKIEDVGEQAGATSKTPPLDIRSGTFN